MDFKQLVIEHFKDGLLLAVKYSTILIILVFVLNYLSGIYQMAMNGNQAAIAIKEYQEKNVLPKFPIIEKK